MMKIASLLLSAVALCLLNTSNAFVPKVSVGMGKMSTTFSKNEAPTTTAIGMDAAMISEMETARAAFVLCLAGALGTAAVGREGEFGIEWLENIYQNTLFSTEFLIHSKNAFLSNRNCSHSHHFARMEESKRTQGKGKQYHVW